jgi:hypothetical protein
VAYIMNGEEECHKKWAILLFQCSVFEDKPGQKFSTFTVLPVRLSLVTPALTSARPFHRTAHTSPVGPMLICFTSQPGGTGIEVHLKPSGAVVLTPVRNITYGTEDRHMLLTIKYIYKVHLSVPPTTSCLVCF